MGQPVTLMTSEGEYLYMPPARAADRTDSAREEQQQPPPAPPLRSVASAGDLAERTAAAAPASPSRSEPATPTIPEACAEEEQGGDDAQVLRLLRGDEAQDDEGAAAEGVDGAPAAVAAGVRDTSGGCADVGTGMD